MDQLAGKAAHTTGLSRGNHFQIILLPNFDLLARDRDLWIACSADDEGARPKGKPMAMSTYMSISM